MRHNLAHRKFNRSTNQRKALLKGLAINIIENEKITTTLPKAKEIRPFLEKLITKGKNKVPLLAYQSVFQVLNHKEATKKVVSVLSHRCQRAGGYLRIIKAGFRYGDQAPMAVIEFVDDLSS